MMGVAILFPVFVQIILTLALLVATGRAAPGCAGREAGAAEGHRPGQRQMARRHAQIRQLLQQSVRAAGCLFYALCLSTLQTANADYLMVLLAWAFVISRIVHAYVHTTSNAVRRRGAAFGIGVLIILVMTVILAARLLLARL